MSHNFSPIYLRARFQCINIYGRTILLRLSDTRAFICFFSFSFLFSFVRFYFFPFCNSVWNSNNNKKWDLITKLSVIHFWSFLWDLFSIARRVYIILTIIRWSSCHFFTHESHIFFWSFHVNILDGKQSNLKKKISN